MLQALSDLYGVSINEILSGERLDDTAYKAKAEENIKATLENSAFTLQERVGYFRKKWLKDHAAGLAVKIGVIAVVMVAGAIVDTRIMTAASFAVIVWSIWERNRRDAYVERKAYQVEEPSDSK